MRRTVPPSSLAPLAPFAALAALVALVTLAACAANTPKVAAPVPATGRVSTKAQRTAVAVTVYNNNSGLVREERTLDLYAGRVSLEFRDVSTEVEPQTVQVKALDQSALSILEQNYRYDLLTPEALLEKSIGKKVKIYRPNKQTGQDDVFEAEILAVSSGVPVFRIGGQITYGVPGGRFAFPEVPANLVAKPSLVWLLDSNTSKARVEVTYLCRGFNWVADYVLSVGEETDATAISKADLTGWVTLHNDTGTSFENAKLKLVAGDVQRVDESVNGKNDYGGAESTPDEKPSQFSQEDFFEYHLYGLERPTDLLSNEQKQVTLLEAQQLDVHRRLVFEGNDYYYRGRYGQVSSNQKVSVFLEIENTEKNHMGMPLPKGVLRVYKADKSGTKQFIGEDRIDHTPRDEKINVKMGESFDVVGDRKQTDYKVLGSCTAETAWEISLRNHKDKADEVSVLEPLSGDWTVVQASIPYTKDDAHTLSFKPSVPARGEVKFTYRVRMKWC
ncbi:DUF4139 domain-containing protein [soil metagenome]